MSAYLETAGQRPASHTWLRRIALFVGLFGCVGLMAWAGLNLSHSPSAPARQVARIALLPDTPPPPPPPPPERPKIEPKETPRQQLDRPKPEILPQPEQLKMEGQAGEGPSPFAAGEVQNDYIGGDIGNGARFAGYVGRVAQAIQDELARRNLRISSARIYLWLTAEGAVQRFEIGGANGDVERVLRTAMADLGRLPEAPPHDMPMPMGLEISGR